MMSLARAFFFVFYSEYSHIQMQTNDGNILSSPIDQPHSPLPPSHFIYLCTYPRSQLAQLSSLDFI